MSKIAIKGNESGTATFTIEAPATNTDRIFELPDEAGKILTDVGVPTSAMPAGSVIQVAFDEHQGDIQTSNGGRANNFSSGVEVLALSFTPLFATSSIVVQTSTISVTELSNHSDLCWVALWDGNSNFITANSGTPIGGVFINNLQSGDRSICYKYPAGSTSNRTIYIRAGMNNNGGAQINGDSNARGFTPQERAVSMIVMEIAG